MRPSLRLPAAALLLAAPLAAQQPSAARIDDRELARRLGAALDSLARLDEFSGVVVVRRGDSTVFARAVGMADREGRRPNTLATAFNLGSINKVFTRLAIRQLELDGKLSSDSTLATYWPDYPNAAVARRVTIRQLLNHRSGLGGDIFAAPPGGTRRDLRRNADLVPLFAARPLDFEPGTSQRYSNAGYVVLGQLVERLSGLDYYAYVRRHIYEPAGMTGTAHFASDSLPAHAAIGYTRGGPGAQAPPGTPWRANRDLLPGRGSAAGGGYSTADDLLRFLAALRARRIPGGPPPGIGAAGGAEGINASLEGELTGGLDVVVLANLDPPAAERVASMIRRWLGSPD